ncbi:hypothetical protein GF361_02105 [Candidatus Woesearchaeota archaeon]|nr:hypothetical protein [Candidatus Woesearchaeota archaeon]
MKDYLDKLKSELKRTEHLFYVSLKYTRTVDVIRSVIQRLINAFDAGMEGILKKKQRRKKTLEIPEQPRKRCEVIKELFADDKELINFIDFYLNLRNIIQAKYDKAHEYRRNVKMITHLGPENDLDVNIDLLLEYYNRAKKFEEYIKEKLG